MNDMIRFAKNADAQLIASWISEDGELLKHLPIQIGKELFNFTSYLVEIGEEKNTLIYEWNGKPVAIATLLIPRYIKLKHYAQLTMIVEEKSRKKGIGSLLLEEICTHAIGQKIEQIDLELYDNPWGVFFEKRGFQSYVTQQRFIKIEKEYLSRTIYRRYI